MNEKAPEEAERGSPRVHGVRCSMYPYMAMSRISWRQRRCAEKGLKLRASEVCACAGESMLPSNTDDVDCVGPQGPSRRSGRSHCMFSSIGRPVQNSTAYPQLAKQTSALCALGVQPEMSPSVFGCKEPRTERYPRSYPSRAPCSGAAGQLRASARE